MTAILLTAVLLGIAWNHSLLYNAWTGGPVTAVADQAPQTGGIPLPLGLMQVKELYDRKEAVFVDARDGATFAAGHITGSISFPLGEAEAQSSFFKKRVPLSKPVVVYCNGYDCHDSRDLGEKLLMRGYGTIYVFEGGYPEWRDAGYPTEGGKR